MTRWAFPLSFGASSAKAWSTNPSSAMAPHISSERRRDGTTRQSTTYSGSVPSNFLKKTMMWARETGSDGTPCHSGMSPLSMKGNGPQTTRTRLSTSDIFFDISSVDSNERNTALHARMTSVLLGVDFSGRLVQNA
jgi:hypothetical protein